MPGLLAQAILCAAIAGGCSGDSQESDMEPSGFLDDYSQLAPGGEGQARLLYIQPEADFSRYDHVLVEPVVLWDPERSAPVAVPAPDQRELVERFQRRLAAQLEQEFKLVREPQPGTLLLRVAITRAEQARAGIEVEIVDATSRERLIGAVDQRVLDPTATSPAADPVAAAFDHWASLIGMRLAAFRNFDAAQKRADPDPSP